MSDTKPAAGPGTRLAAGQLGTAHVIFFVLAAAAPMAVVVALLPISLLLGVGVGTPLLLLLTTLLLALFAVGYVRAVPHVRNAGAFYAYISQGLGRPVGLAAAYVAAVCYTALAAATSGAMAFFAQDSASRLLGIDLPWPVWAAVGLAVIGLLSYRRVTQTARVLGVALVLEVGLLLVLMVAVLVRGGPGAWSLDVFSPSYLAGGALGVGIIYAVASFMGFEGTAIYAEETKDPVRTIPRATFGAIAVAGAFYVICAWGVIAALGASDAVAAAGEDPGTLLFRITEANLGRAAGEVLGILVVTSSFAAVLALHNAAARYFYALARDGYLPAALARTHPRFGSPYAASLAQLGLLALIVLGFAVAGLDPLLNLSTAMTGFGVVGLEALLTLTSFAIAAFFWRRGSRSVPEVVAPLLAGLGLAVATVLSLANYPSLTGSTSEIINALPWLHLPVVVIGVGVALWFRARDRARYDAMGRTSIVDVDRGAEAPAEGVS